MKNISDVVHIKNRLAGRQVDLWVGPPLQLRVNKRNYTLLELDNEFHYDDLLSTRRQDDEKVIQECF